MARGNAPLAEKGRPHVNGDKMQHRDFLTPGPVACELRMRPSQYQQMACGPSRRGADASTNDPCAGSPSGRDMPRTKKEKVEPVKALKVIYHRFSNGQPTNQLKRGRSCYENEDRSARAGGSQIGEGSDGRQAVIASSLYQATQLEDRNRQPREHDLGPSEREQVRGRFSRRRTKQNHGARTLGADETSEDQTGALPKNEDAHAAEQGVLPSHFCTGLACEHPDCTLSSRLENFASDLLLNDMTANVFNGMLLSHYDQSTSSRIPNDHPQPVFHRAVADPISNTLQTHQNPLMSIRDMAVDIFPAVDDHARNSTSNTEVAEAAHVSGKANLR